MILSLLKCASQTFTSISQKTPNTFQVLDAQLPVASISAGAPLSTSRHFVDGLEIIIQG